MEIEKEIVREVVRGDKHNLRKKKKKELNLAKQLYIRWLVDQPGVARAFALRAEVCRFAPPTPFSFLASRSLNPEMNTLPYGENLLFAAYVILGFVGKDDRMTGYSLLHVCWQRLGTHQKKKKKRWKHMRFHQCTLATGWEPDKKKRRKSLRRFAPSQVLRRFAHTVARVPVYLKVWHRGRRAADKMRTDRHYCFIDIDYQDRRAIQIKRRWVLLWCKCSQLQALSCTL